MPVRQSVNILVATPYADFRQAIATLLRDNFDVRVIGESENGEEALRLFRSHAWDVAMLGIRLPVGGGLHFLRVFKAERPSLPVVMVCAQSLPLVLRPALDGGACSYVMWDDIVQDLVPSVRAALVDEVYQSAAMR